MKRSDINPMPQFFDRYINQVDDLDIVEALEKYDTIESLIDKTILEELGDKIYAPGKWTVKDLLQHISDNERVQAYRALRISRKDETVLPGYDEGLFAKNADPARRNLSDLLAEFAAIRRSNIMMYRSFSDEMQQRTGICFNTPISVLALGFVLVGHQIHHCTIIKERYAPLLSS